MPPWTPLRASPLPGGGWLLNRVRAGATAFFVPYRSRSFHYTAASPGGFCPSGAMPDGSGSAWYVAQIGLRGWCSTVVSGTGWLSSSGAPAALHGAAVTMRWHAGCCANTSPLLQRRSWPPPRQRAPAAGGAGLKPGSFFGRSGGGAAESWRNVRLPAAPRVY
jgi:hypothetical protein